MKRIVILGAGMAVVGLLAAAPAGAQEEEEPPCEPQPQCEIVNGFIEDNLVSQTIRNYKNLIPDTIQNYTGVDIRKLKDLKDDEDDVEPAPAPTNGESEENNGESEETEAEE